MTSRPSTAAPILAALLILAVPLGAYVAGYFLLAESQISLTELPDGTLRSLPLRCYKHQFMAVLSRGVHFRRSVSNHVTTIKLCCASY